MKKLAIRLGFCALAAAGGEAAAQELVRHPVSFGTTLDYGQVVKGRFFEQPGPDSVADGQVITRTGFFLSEGAGYGNLDIRVTIGGLFWSVLPEASAEFEKRLVYFGAGIGQAQAVYSIGGTENPWGTISVGYFPIKYNSDAKDLGEYLYRSGTYPGTLYTGGWSFLNSAAYMAEGVRFDLPTFSGALTHDFTLTMERDPEPLYDFSPAYTLAWKPGSHFVLGAGAMWAHGLAFQPDSIITPIKCRNAYVKSTGKPVMENSANACTDNVKSDTLGYYTYQGVKLMAHTSLDLGGLLGMDDAIGEGAFKLYGEWAWLGVKDQPFFYDKPMERMPIMVGLNIPTFKLLDMLGVEVEYHKSRFPNTIRSGFIEKLPLPWDAQTDVSAYDESTPGFAERNKDFKKDDVKWALYAKRTLRQGLTLHAQAASDHIRFVTTEGGGKFRPTYTPSTRDPSQWYYVLRLEIGI